MLQHTNGTHLQEGMETYLNNHHIGHLVQETIISHTKDSLIHNNHPRHQLSLATLREVTARHKKEINTPEIDKDRKISFDYTLEAIQKMQEIGLSQETISAIVDSLYDLSLNYHNSKEKIRSLGKITFRKIVLGENIFSGKKMVDIRRKPHKNIIKNIENNIGGSCGELTQAYRDIFDKRGIFKLLQKDTKNDDMFIETICGHDRKYFTKRMSNHIYCTLRVGDIVFGIDPSLCEINIYNESGYRERAKNKKPTSLASIQEENLYREAEVFNFSSRDKVISQETDGDILPLDPRRNEKDTGLVLGMLDDTDYIALIRYVRLRGKNYPCLCLNKDYKDMIIGVLGKNKDLRINRKQTPERLKEKIEEHLLILDSITEYS